MLQLEHVMTDPWLDISIGLGLGTPVAIGGRITADTLLGAYRRAMFCQPRIDPEQIEFNRTLYSPDVVSGDIPILPGDGDPYSTLWWSPQTRYVIPAAGVRLGRTSRRNLRNTTWTTTVDADFEGVIAGCRGEREPRWLTADIISALRELWEAGWVRTVEVWDDARLIGGLFGCALAGVFIMDSAFHLDPEAAKVAIADLGRRATGGGISLLDTQVRTEYTVRMGAREISRDEYLDRLDVYKGQGAVDGALGYARDLLM